MTQPPYPNTPLGPGTRYPWDPAPAPAAVQVPAAGNIDPNAGRPMNPYGTVGEPAPSGLTQTQPTTSAAPPNYAPGTSIQQPDPIGGIGNPAVDNITAQSRQQLANANAQVTQIYQDLQDTQAKFDKAVADKDVVNAPLYSSQLQSIYARLVGAQQSLSTANTSFAASVDNALRATTVDPAQADAYRAQAANSTAAAREADARAQVLVDGADTQKQKTAADAALSSNQALLAKANADAVNAKSDADRQVAQNQANLYGQQANQIQQLLPGLVAKQQADTTLTQHQVSLTDSQSALYQAEATAEQSRAGLQQAQGNLYTAQAQQLVPQQAAATGAQAGLYGAQTQAALADIQQKQQGALYGLPQQIETIKNTIFGPGGSGDPNEANDLLQKYITSTISGTTPYAASVAAANAGLTQFGTQASMFNAAQSALASRANALAGLGGNVLSTLGTMNANAPAGSTAMAAAFKNVMDYALAQQGQAQQQAAQQFGGNLQQPNAPALPPLLQKLAGVGGGAPAPAAAGGLSGATGMPTPPPVTSTPAVAGQPNPAAPATGSGQAGQGQGVQINVSTGGSQNATTQPAPPAGGYAPPAQQPGTYGQLSGSMPAMLQKSMPLNNQQATDYLHQLWGPELNSGAVQSPYASMGQPTPYVGG
jgi:hypothetical protein